MPYVAMQTLLDPLYPRGMWNYFRSAFFTDLDDATTAALVSSYAQAPNALSELHIHHLGGAMARVPAGMGPLAIGLALTLIHLISIPVTNTSVNPARSTGPALFVGGWALGQPRSAPRDPGRIVLFRTVAGADEQRFRGRVTRLSARTALAVQSCSSVCRAARLVQRATRGTEAAVEADTQQPIPGTSR
jgi:hypothetical protein